MKKQTQIYSIFGQIESVVAQAMIDEKVVTKIESGDIPPTARYDDEGRVAHFAIVIPSSLVPAFERRVRDLRA